MADHPTASGLRLDLCCPELCLSTTTGMTSSREPAATPTMRENISRFCRMASMPPTLPPNCPVLFQTSYAWASHSPRPSPAPAAAFALPVALTTEDIPIADGRAGQYVQPAVSPCAPRRRAPGVVDEQQPHGRARGALYIRPAGRDPAIRGGRPPAGTRSGRGRPRLPSLLPPGHRPRNGPPRVPSQAAANHY